MPSFEELSKTEIDGLAGESVLDWGDVVESVYPQSRLARQRRRVERAAQGLAWWEANELRYPGLLDRVCLNCDGQLKPATRSVLFCSELCQQVAKYVRYARNVVRDGRIDRPDVQEAVEIRLALIFGGGYPEKERRIPREVRTAVFARDGGRCRHCGAQATEIDHVGGPVAGDINALENLQVLCSACHREKTKAGFRTVTRESDPELLESLNWQDLELNWRDGTRVLAEVPERISDDETQWESVWRSIETARAKIFARA